MHLAGAGLVGPLRPKHGRRKMKTMIAVVFAAASLVGSTLAMAQPFAHDDPRSGWGPPTGTERDIQQQLQSGASR